jgi:hypothetical protein
MRSFDWGNPMHWAIFFFCCTIYNIFSGPINKALAGVGITFKAFGEVPLIAVSGGSRLVAPELGRYSVPGNVGGPLPEAIALDELNPGNE